MRWRLTEAIITAEGLSISPIRANPTDEIDEIARRLYGMLPRLRITELLADSSGDRLDKDPAVEYRDARLLPDASGEPSRRPRLRLLMVRIFAPEGIGSVQTGPDATSKRANLFGAIYSIAVSKSNPVYSVRLIGNPHN